MPTRINQARINQSCQGYAVPVGFGCFKIQQSLLWLDGYSSHTISGNTGGNKGLGGGKGGNEYDYLADVIACLCDSSTGVTGVRDVWSGSSWLSNGGATETYTIPTGGGIYTPAYATRMVVDHGVSASVPVSGSFNDVGSSAPTVISGVSTTPFKAVPYGTALSAGEYAVNPATGAYSFAAADAGTEVLVNYSFTLKQTQQQTKAIIPSSLEVTLGTNITPGEGSFYKNISVTYYSDGTSAPDNGVALTDIPTGSAPTVTGTYNVNGTLPAVYNFAPGDLGKEVLITYQIDVSMNLLTGTPSSLNFLLISGGLLQSPWSLLEASYPYASLGYSGKALVCYSPMDLGEGGNVQQNTFEVVTADAWGGGIVDANPVQCILQVLTNPVWGLGAGPVPFPVSAIDNGTGGTWGIGTNSGLLKILPPRLRTGGQVVQASTAADWFAANSFFISPAIDKQDTASSLISRWLEAGQCAAFMSEGLLKLVPYGDTTTSGNGSTWVAPSAYAASLTDDDFITDGDKDPVELSCSPWMDAYNKVQISWNNRANQYENEVTPESDQAAVNRYGLRLEDPQTYDFITTLPAATFAGSMRVKRSVYTRNTYSFKLRFKWEELECMDVVQITTSSSWAAAVSNQNLNVVTLPVRIIKWVDNPDGTFDVTAEDYPFGVHQPTIYKKVTGQPQALVSQQNDPGDTTAVVFEATDRLTGYTGDEIWIGAAGSNADWGGCNVLASMDGDTYLSIGTIKAAARLGTLAAALPNGLDPDTVNSLVVNLNPNAPALEGGTDADADQDNTLCYVDGELIAYSACVISGPNQYTMGATGTATIFDTPNLQTLSGWALHTEGAGTPPTTTPPTTFASIGGVAPTSYSFTPGTGGSTALTLACANAGSAYADWMAYLAPRPILSTTGQLQLSLTLTPDANCATDAQCIEIDTIISSGGYNYNGSCQLNYAAGGHFQIVNAAGAWVDCGFNPGILSAAPHSLIFTYAYDTTAKTFSFVSIELDGVVHAISGTLQNVPAAAMGWATGVILQLQQDLNGTTGGHMSYAVDNVQYSWPGTGGTAGYLRRGQMGSVPPLTFIPAHAAGSQFLRLDASVFHYTYDPSWYGKTVYLKFQSFNSFGNGTQDPSTLTALAFVVPGLNPGSVSAATGAVGNLGGVAANTIIQGLVNAGGVPGSTGYPSLTLTPSTYTNPGSPVTYTPYLNGTAISPSLVTWTLGSGSYGTISSAGVWTPPGGGLPTSPSGSFTVVATLTSNPLVFCSSTIVYN